MGSTRVWFIRHGEVEAPWVGTFLGTKDVGLSPLGRHQAEAIKEYLSAAPIDAVVSSPRKRALDTIAPLAKHLGKKIEVRKGLGEMDFGAWEGLAWEQIVARDAGEAAAWERDTAQRPCPDGESCQLFHERIGSVWKDVLHEFKGRSIAIGAHAGTNRSILGHVLGIGYMECMAFAQDYGCVNAVGFMPQGFAQVALLNFVPGPKAEKQGD